MHQTLQRPDHHYGRKNQQRIYIGTKLKGVVRGIENYYSLNGNYNTPAGTYQVDRKAGTYKKLRSWMLWTR